MAQTVNGKKMIEKKRRWSYTNGTFNPIKRQFSHMSASAQKQQLKAYDRQCLSLEQIAELEEIHNKRIWL
jgi:hypothetical protein